jgi:hypothetical protein
MPRPGVTALHWATLQLAADETNVPIKPPCLDRGDVFWATDNARALELMGFVMFAGGAALRRCGATGNSVDDLVGRSLVFDSIRERWGLMAIHTPSLKRQGENRIAELKNEAETLISSKWDQIQTRAIDLEAA